MFPSALSMAPPLCPIWSQLCTPHQTGTQMLMSNHSFISAGRLPLGTKLGFNTSVRSCLVNPSSVADPAENLQQ